MAKKKDKPPGLHFQCRVGNVSTLANHDMGVRITTLKELSLADKVKLIDMANTEGYCLISPAVIPDEDVPKGPLDYKGRSLSKLYRDCLYRFWQANIEGTGVTAEDYYKKKMMSLIESVKATLPDGKEVF